MTDIMDCRYGFSAWWYLIPLAMMWAAAWIKVLSARDRVAFLLAASAVWLMWMAVIQAGSGE